MHEIISLDKAVRCAGTSVLGADVVIRIVIKRAASRKTGVTNRAIMLKMRTTTITVKTRLMSVGSDAMAASRRVAKLARKKTLTQPLHQMSRIGIRCARSGGSLIIHLVGTIVVVVERLHDAEGDGLALRASGCREARSDEVTNTKNVRICVRIWCLREEGGSLPLCSGVSTIVEFLPLFRLRGSTYGGVM
jgi:hypothetical protein